MFYKASLKYRTLDKIVSKRLQIMQDKVVILLTDKRLYEILLGLKAQKVLKVL